MSTTFARKLGLWACLLAAGLPRTSTSPAENVEKDPTGDDKRVLANSALNHAGCSIDMTGHYTSEYGVLLKIIQTDCSLFLVPPGKVVGLVMGRGLNIAGQEGHIVGGGNTINEIRFINGAVWTKQVSTEEDPPGGTTTTTLQAKVETSSRSQASENPCDAATYAGIGKETDSSATTSTQLAAVSPVSMPASVQVTTTFPWWAVGTGIAIAGVGAIAGGVAAAAVTHNQAAKAPTHNTTETHSTKEQRPIVQTDAPAASLRFMAPTAPAELSEGGGTQHFLLSNGGEPGLKKAESAGATPQAESVGPMAQATIMAPRIYLLGVLAILACCFVLMLVGMIVGIYSWRSSKASRSLRVVRTESQHSSVSEEASDDESDEEEEITETPLLRTVPQGN